MPRNIALIFLFSLSLPIIAACGRGADPIASVTILPEECQLIVEQEMSLKLDGFIPPRAVVHWDVDQGDIMFVLTGLEAIFVAPSEPTVVTISALITPAVPGTKTPITRQCVVTALNRAPGGLALAERFEELFGSWLKIPNS